MNIHVVANVLKSEQATAAANRQRLDNAGVFALNVMSAPGSGKTTLLERTLSALGPERCAVLVGDLQTTRDADRLGRSGSEIVQINTGRGCHLSPAQVAAGLGELTLDGLDYVFIENVGNMVCPAAHDLGEHERVVLLSSTEGDDKVAKYPVLFQPADIVLITKVDLFGIVDFDVRNVYEDLARLNTRASVIECSAKTGAGFDTWLDWLGRQLQERRSKGRDACAAGAQE